MAFVYPLSFTGRVDTFGICGDDPKGFLRSWTWLVGELQSLSGLGSDLFRGCLGWVAMQIFFLFWSLCLLRAFDRIYEAGRFVGGRVLRKDRLFLLPPCWMQWSVASSMGISALICFLLLESISEIREDPTSGVHILRGLNLSRIVGSFCALLVFS